MTRLNQSGSHILGMALLLVALGVVGFAGYKVTQASKVKTASSALTASTATVPAAIHTRADLTQASKVLDTSSAQLSSGLNDTGLDADLSSML